MKIGIMQPYFFPYIGYFSLIKHTEKFILLDEVQYIRHGWIERNRILKPKDGWQFIKVPLEKHKRETQIKNIKINNQNNWRKLILAQLEHYKKKAEFYHVVIGLLNDIFKEDYSDISNLNKAALVRICQYLGFSPDIEIFSNLGIEVERPNAPDEWALNICKLISNADEYWNPIGGVSFFDKKKYFDAGFQLRFHTINITTYYQGGRVFEPGLSIIDVLMFNSPEAVNLMLDNYEIN